MKKSSLFVLLIGIATLVVVSVMGPASAAQPPHPEHPAHPVHPKANPTVGTTTVDTPVTCTFAGTTPPTIFTTTAHVSVTSPAQTQPNAPYSADFLVVLDGLVAPLDVENFRMTTTYDVSGSVTPNGALVFTETPQDVAAGDQPTPTTFSQTFTPGSHTTISYRFDDVSYDFNFAGTDNIHADCTLDDGPVVVRQTDT